MSRSCGESARQDVHLQSIALVSRIRFADAARRAAVCLIAGDTHDGAACNLCSRLWIGASGFHWSSSGQGFRLIPSNRIALQADGFSQRVFDDTKGPCRLASFIRALA
jgi:hypothetical protein